MKRTWTFAGILCTIGAISGGLGGCNNDPTNAEMMDKYNKLPSNNPDLKPPPDNPREKAMQEFGGGKPGGTKPGGKPGS
jgi:hypothetical protein